MIQKSLVLAAALAGVSLTTAAFAYSPKNTTPPPRVIASSVVSPTNLPRAFAGEVVNVAFHLDASGQPRDIEVLWVSDAQLKKQLVEAFRQWRFDVTAADKDAATKRFVLPIQLTPEA